MSGDMFTAMSANSDGKEKKRKFMRVGVYDKLEKCSYKGDCKWRRSSDHKHSLCSLCKYKVLSDIPRLIDEELFRKFGVK